MKKNVKLEEIRKFVKVERAYLTERLDDLTWKEGPNSNEYKDILNVLLQLNHSDEEIRIGLTNGWINEEQAVKSYKMLIKKLFIDPLGII